MVSVCIPFVNNGHEQTNWDYLLSNFQVNDIFIIGKEGDELPNTNVYGKGTFITSYYELPHTSKLVLLAPKAGKNIQGDENIIDFVHPQENVVYIVGSNHKHIELEDFEDKPIDHKVYIETDTIDEMFNWIAMTVLLYDRRIKLNG